MSLILYLWILLKPGSALQRCNSVLSFVGLVPVIVLDVIPFKPDFLFYALIVGFLGAILTNYHKLGRLKTIEVKSFGSGG